MDNHKPIYLVLLCFSLLSLQVFAKPPHSFEEAKKKMYQIYSEHRISVYCQCDFNEQKETDFASCGYQVRKDRQRASRMEAEHIVPAWVFGHELVCWKQKKCSDSKGKKYGGRKCCRKIDPYFRQMESDLYNLAPAVGEVNADRQDYPFLDWHGTPNQYGQCEILIDSHGQRVQPPLNQVRGFIARTYLYMNQQYHLQLDDDYINMLQQWSKQFPEDSWEKLRKHKIDIIYNS